MGEDDALPQAGLCWGMEGDGALLKVLLQREVGWGKEALLKVLPWRVKMITVLQAMGPHLMS
jgi:hypothetical protein